MIFFENVEKIEFATEIIPTSGPPFDWFSLKKSCFFKLKRIINNNKYEVRYTNLKIISIVPIFLNTEPINVFRIFCELALLDKNIQ